MQDYCCCDSTGIPVAETAGKHQGNTRETVFLGFPHVSTLQDYCCCDNTGILAAETAGKHHRNRFPEVFPGFLCRHELQHAIVRHICFRARTVTGCLAHLQQVEPCYAGGVGKVLQRRQPLVRPAQQGRPCRRVPGVRRHSEDCHAGGGKADQRLWRQCGGAAGEHQAAAAGIRQRPGVLQAQTLHGGVESQRLYMLA